MVTIQHLFGLLEVSVCEVVGEELGQILEDALTLGRCEELVGLDLSEELLFNDVILELKVFLGKLFEYLLHGDLINFCIGIKPLEFLVNLDKDSAPVCRELKFVFCINDTLGVDLLSGPL